MTDENIPQEATDAPVTPEETARDQEGNPANREAAKYRTRLREVEASVTPLNEQITAQQATIEALQRTIIEKQITESAGVSPAGVFALHPIADFLSEEGTVDPDKVTAIANAAAEQLGLARQSRSPRADFSQGPAHSAVNPTWSDLLRQ